MNKTMRTLILALLFVFATIHQTEAAGIDPANHDVITRYARELLLHRITGQNEPAAPQAARSIQRACFVTFFHKGRVFACFGGFSPRTASLSEEIRENIRLALKNDPRAAAIRPETVAACKVQITLPGQPQRIYNPLALDPSREGLFVEAPDGRGVAIVPGEAKTASFALRSALFRLGLSSTTPDVRLYRFSASIIR